MRRFTSVAVVSIVLCHAHAEAQESKPDNKACNDAYIANQRFRKDGKLTAAKRELLQCVQPSCPTAIQSDCAQWLGELDKNLPTIVVAAQSGGQDVLDVKVTIDGTLTQSKLDGLPLALDPGAHEIVFEYNGARVTQTILAQQGVKNRPVNISFDKAPPPAASSVPVPPAPAPVPAAPPPPVPASAGDASSTGRNKAELIAGGIIGALALGGAAAWIGLGLVGKSKAQDLGNRCGPATTGVCAQHDIDNAKRLLLGADVSMGLTLAAVATSAGLLIHYAVSGEPAKATAFSLVPVPGGAAGAMTLAF